MGSMLINLKQYIPESMHLAKNQEEQLYVELDLTKYQKKVLDLPVGQIKVVGFDAETTDVKVIDTPSSIVMYFDTGSVDPDTITIETLKPIIKVQDAVYGKYNATISITDIEGVEIVSDLAVKYELIKKGGK